jgi:hypothetical protein
MCGVQKEQNKETREETFIYLLKISCVSRAESNSLDSIRLAALPVQQLRVERYIRTCI